MSNQTVQDIQQVIDRLFERLDNAKTGGEITQCTHSLRVQITKKRKLGGSLAEREQEIVAAVGEIAEKKSGGSLWIFVLAIIVIAGLYFAYTYISKHS